MFKSTKYLKAEQFDRLTEDVGGMNNASTREDVTNYFAVVPSNHLERLLWAEAERMSNLDVSEANFKSERAVVQEEYRQRVLANPTAASTRRSRRARTPCIRTGAASSATSPSSTRRRSTTCARFTAPITGPTTRILIVTGDFDPKELDAWIDKYFGAIPRPATPIPRVSAVEPAAHQRRAHRETGPNVPLPAVAITWLGPSARSPDAGGAARSRRRFSATASRRASTRRWSIAARSRRRRRSAPTCASIRACSIAYAIAAKGTTPDALARALRAEIERLAQKPVPGSRARQGEDRSC